jgi:anthranilate synthase component 2
MFVLIDNYDSFTYNLYHFLGELGASVEVRRNDQLSAEDVMAMRPQGIILSPGPCDPDRAGICLDLIKTAAGKLPILGVCLGHQAIGQAFGGRVVRAPLPMHGKLSSLKHSGEGIFEDIPSPFTATRYHSLTVERSSLPDCLISTAETEDGVIMGLAHRSLPIYGVQFHPESIASEHGHRLLGNFLRRAGHNVKPVTRQRHNVKAVA